MQWLAWQIITDHFIDPVKEVDLVIILASYNLLEQEVIIKCQKEIMKEVKKDNPGLILLTNGLKLDSAQVAAAVC